MKIKIELPDKKIKDFVKGFSTDIEPKFNEAFIQAIKKEFERRNFADSAVADFLKIGFLQTAHHQCLSNGPTFNAIDLVTICALQSNPYFVACYSSVPYSNSAVSGAFTFYKTNFADIIDRDYQKYKQLLLAEKTSLEQGNAEKRLYMIPNSYKNILLFNSPVPETKFSAFKSEVKEKLIDPTSYNNFNDWAMDTCQLMQRQIYSKQNIYYFDLNRVILDYLTIAEDSFLYRLLDNKEQLAGDIDGDLFESYENGSRVRYAYEHIAKKRATSIDDFTNWLKSGRNAPTTTTVFIVLLYDLHLKLLGSYLQTAYLTGLINSLNSLKNNAYESYIKDVSVAHLNGFCYARFPKSEEFRHSFDFFIHNKNIDYNLYLDKNINYFNE